MKQSHLDRDWLWQKYIVEGLSTYDIGKIVGRNPKRVYEKLRDFGIPTRSRGHNLSGSDNYNSKPGAVGTFKGRHHTAEARRKISEQASRPRPHLRGKRNGMYARTGASNPNYRGGTTPARQSAYSSSRWKRLARRVFLRDGCACVRCGLTRSTRRGMHIHHIKSWASCPSLRFDPANLITLCRDCHEWVHSRKNTSGLYL